MTGRHIAGGGQRGGEAPGQACAAMPARWSLVIQLFRAQIQENQVLHFTDYRLKNKLTPG